MFRPPPSSAEGGADFDLWTDANHDVGPCLTGHVLQFRGNTVHVGSARTDLTPAIVMEGELSAAGKGDRNLETHGQIADEIPELRAKARRRSVDSRAGRRFANAHGVPEGGRHVANELLRWREASGRATASGHTHSNRWVGTNDNPASGMTKGLPEAGFQRDAKRLGMLRREELRAEIEGDADAIFEHAAPGAQQNQ